MILLYIGIDRYKYIDTDIDIGQGSIDTDIQIQTDISSAWHSTNTVQKGLDILYSLSD